ncbi:DNA cytosine methyltransferase [Methylobacterium gossipiicola]|uniref:DNA (cytosine-5-)-methyltransferase n=1 Tax=Methylobacterium gossipiicola TaxID=582675 RepID=A0A1I2TLB7_9HYPH|nr:DNA cytosine methyltransferase [Methylobacterium gossipiicola]SFG65712.1 DNA (cytosine-5)-methyltransferase 1 [Methylobacterium gossipiicola]
MTRPLIIDSFAGGGGASEGIRAALGRDPDYALNHNPIALAMHRINHPDTHHVEEDVWNVDAVGLCAGRPVGLLWMSPDCKHFSKAKGGKPREKQIRGLAWVGVRWIKSLPKRQRPRLVCLENVEEFQDWGPLLEDGRPCPVQKGATFQSFVAAFRAMGYAVEWRELRACDYGAPTIRKRLFLVARRDGRPIVWPAPTHGGPTNPGVIAGVLKPWRTAAEIIDWSLPCPSIFETSAEIKARYGIRANRPLADATMARIAKGTKRYVLDAAKPFLVQINHGGSTGGRDHAVDEPMPTMTGKRGEAVVTSFVSYAQQGGANRDITAPLHTITASPKDHNTVVAPHLIRVDQTSGDPARKGVHAVGDPVSTITTAGAQAVVSGFLVPRYGERLGQDPRTRSLEEPFPALVPTGNEGSLAAIHMTRQFGASVGSDVEEPVGTITAGGAGKAGVVAAFLAQHNLGAVGHDAREPLSTLSQKGSQQQVVAAHMLNLRGSDRRDGPVDAPAPTFSAGGNHAAAVYAFLSKYYGSGAIGQAANEPAHTLTAKDRHGVVTVSVEGQPYAIVDIGMRMLTPRERFCAQGFRPDYVIDRGEMEDGTIIPLTLEQQGSACGNSVCPDMAKALIGANADAIDFDTVRTAAAPAAMPLFAAE